MPVRKEPTVISKKTGKVNPSKTMRLQFDNEQSRRVSNREKTPLGREINEDTANDKRKSYGAKENARNARQTLAAEKIKKGRKK